MHFYTSSQPKPTQTVRGSGAPAQVQLLRLLLQPERFLTGLHQRFGTTFTVRMPVFYDEVVIVAHPQCCWKVMTLPAARAVSGPDNLPLFAEFSGNSSVVTKDGEPHVAARRMLSPMFQPAQLEGLAEGLYRSASVLAAGWSNGQRVRLVDAIQDLTLKAVFELIFGRARAPELMHLNAAVLRYLEFDANPFYKLPPLQRDLGAWSPWGRFLRLRDRIDRELHLLIEQARSGADFGTGILARLARADAAGADLGAEQIRDHLMTLFVGGNTTTAIGAAWVIACVSEHADVRARCLDELEEVVGDAPLAGRHLPQLKFLTATIRETLRLHPLLPFAMVRRLREPLELDDVELRAGSAVLPCIYLAHRSPRVWTDPARFDPARFLQAKPDAKHYFPFGGGLHRCLGEHFALLEMQAVVAALLRSTRFEFAAGDPLRAVFHGVMFAPARGAAARVYPR